jgi:signal transduction histidine kinase
MISEAQTLLRRGPSSPASVVGASTRRWLLCVLGLAAAYYAAAKVGQTLRYTGSVAALWPPVGVGIAGLYFLGLRCWPGIVLGELAVNAELYYGSTRLPLESAAGQQLGNVLEVVLGAVLLRRLAGPRVELDRVEQVSATLIAVGIATALSATFGTISMLAGSVIDHSEAPVFWRTWWLGDTSGALVILPLALAWAARPWDAWRRMRSAEGLLLIAAVAALSTIAVTSDAPLTYVVFPALIWAALRFGPVGATAAVAITAAITIGITADDVGPFSKQAITDRTLSTQLYVAVAALTALFLSAVVAERRRWVAELAAVREHEGELASEERHRIGRDLHDSVSQSLFSILLQTRTAQRALKSLDHGVRPVGAALDEIADLTGNAQEEMRSLIFQLGRDPVQDGLVVALTTLARHLGAREGLAISVAGPAGHLPLTPVAEQQLYAIGRESLTNVVKHAAATAALIRVGSSDGRVILEVEDNGRGFDPGAFPEAGHFGLASMRSRATEIGGTLSVTSSPRGGTTVRVDVPALR